MAITVYRVTVHGDGIGGADQIIFNNPSQAHYKDPKYIGAYITDVQYTNTSALAENQSPGQDTAGLQHQGEIEDVYILTIKFTRRDITPHAFQDIFDTWVSQPKVNAAFINGRFGIQIDDRIGKNIVPEGTGSSQIGLMWLDADEKEDYMEPKVLPSKITLRFKVSRSDGT